MSIENRQDNKLIAGAASLGGAVAAGFASNHFLQSMADGFEKQALDNASQIYDLLVDAAKDGKAYADIEANLQKLANLEHLEKLKEQFDTVLQNVNLNSKAEFKTTSLIRQIEDLLVGDNNVDKKIVAATAVIVGVGLYSLLHNNNKEQLLEEKSAEISR